MVSILRHLSKRNAFQVDYYNKPHQVHFVSKEDELKLVDELSNSSKPAVYVRHIYWIPFKDQVYCLLFVHYLFGMDTIPYESAYATLSLYQFA